MTVRFRDVIWGGGRGGHWPPLILKNQRGGFPHAPLFDKTKFTLGSWSKFYPPLEKLK